MHHAINAFAPFAAKVLCTQGRPQGERLAGDRELAEIAGAGFVSHVRMPSLFDGPSGNKAIQRLGVSKRSNGSLTPVQ